jgi:hypothetical protein
MGALPRPETTLRAQAHTKSLQSPLHRSARGPLAPPVEQSCPPARQFPADAVARRILVCRLAVMVVRGKHPDELVRGGPGFVPPVLVHTPAMLLGPLLAQRLSSKSKSCPGAMPR